RMMRRRTFVQAGAAALAAASAAAWAQQTKVVRLALVSTGVPIEQMTLTGEARFAAFLAEMSRLGYAEEGNLALSRWATAGLAKAKFDNLPRQTVASRPDIIVPHGSRLILALKNATATIPIVFISAADPVGWGLVASLSRPGGNVTGFATDPGPGLVGKRLQF